jgi:2-dehydropantoate 2-reductase
MRYVVVGAGGVGGYLGGRLAAAGRDVTFIARGAHLAALRTDGLTVQSITGDFAVRPVAATDDPRDAGVTDVVLVCVKTWQLPAALPLLAPLMGPDTVVITTQNGVTASDEVARVVGSGAVLPGVVQIFAHISGPGRIAHLGGPARLAFGEPDAGISDRTRALDMEMRGSGMAAYAAADIRADMWAKFLFVVPFGSLGAATGAPIGVLRKRRGTRALMSEAMGEIERIARASGVALPAAIVASTMEFVDQQPTAGQSSLQRDLLAGRPSELEAWTGEVVRQGVRTGIPTPVHSFLYELLAARQSLTVPGWGEIVGPGQYGPHP